MIKTFVAISSTWKLPPPLPSPVKAQQNLSNEFYIYICIYIYKSVYTHTSIRWIMFEDSPIVLFAPTGLNSPPGWKCYLGIIRSFFSSLSRPLSFRDTELPRPSSEIFHAFRDIVPRALSRNASTLPIYTGLLYSGPEEGRFERKIKRGWNAAGNEILLLIDLRF